MRKYFFKLDGCTWNDHSANKQTKTNKAKQQKQNTTNQNQNQKQKPKQLYLGENSENSAENNIKICAFVSYDNL